MIYTCWFLGILLFCVGSFVAILNWGVFWSGFVKREECPSVIPLLGGLFLSGSFALVPITFLREWWWMGFILDWGSLPSIAYAALWHLSRKLQQ